MKKNNLIDKSFLFNKAGYLKLEDYLTDALRKEENYWQLPLGLLEKCHLSLLKWCTKISWFSSFLYILHPHNESPFYTALLKYLKKEGLFDFYIERNMHYPGIYSYYLEKKLFLKNVEYYINARGVGETPELALSKALGEMIERLVTGVLDKNTKITKESVRNLRQLRKSVFYPPDFHKFLKPQTDSIGILNHGLDDQTDWVDGYNLMNKKRVYIPRQVTSWFEGTRNCKKLFLNSTTNGAAAYFTKDGAILRGLLEVIQRDGFFVHWLTKTAPQVISSESLPLTLKTKVDIFTTLGISISILDINSLSLPSICIMAISEKADLPMVVVSAAANLSYEEAILDGLNEMMATIEMLYIKTPSSILDYKAPPFISDLDKLSRQSYWQGKEKLAQMNWFISGKEIKFQDLENNYASQLLESEKLKILIKKLTLLGKDYQPIIYEPQNIAAKNVRMYVVQTYIPKAFPLYLVEKYGTFASERLTEFAKAKGRENFVLNPDPHMFS